MRSPGLAIPVIFVRIGGCAFLDLVGTTLIFSQVRVQVDSQQKEDYKEERELGGIFAILSNQNEIIYWNPEI